MPIDTTKHETIREAYERIGTIQGAAIECGCDRTTVRRALRSMGGRLPISNAPDSPDEWNRILDIVESRLLARLAGGATVNEGPPAPQGGTGPAPNPVEGTQDAPQAILPPKPADGIYRADEPYSRVAVLSDLHVPYHDQAAVNAALEVCEAWQPDLIVINGDLFDSYLISAYEKEPKRLRSTLQGEFDAGKPIVKRITSLQGRKKYILGNHEARIDALVAKNPGLADLRALEWHRMAEIPDSWDILPQYSRLRIGHLDIHHGDIKQGPGGKYVAATMLADLKRSSVFGHFHRDQFYAEPDGDGVLRGGFGCGHLCDEAEAAKYCRLNRWTKGFRSIDIDPTTGLFEVRSHLIHRGKTRFNGTTYGG